MKQPEIQITYIGGVCPVTAEGTVNNLPFEFRARWDRWELFIDDEDLNQKPDLFYYGGEYDGAGWMCNEEVISLIKESAKKHFATRRAQK
jgi:hypothetical protein